MFMSQINLLSILVVICAKCPCWAGVLVGCIYLEMKFHNHVKFVNSVVVLIDFGFFSWEFF